MEPESTRWKASPSQWLNLGPFAASLAVAVAVGAAAIYFEQPLLWLGLIPAALWALWRYLVIRCHTFELTCERLRVKTGVINQHIDEIELYRVKDTNMRRVWWMRLTGLYALDLETSDRSMPQVTIPAIPNGIEVRELLRKRVEFQRDRKRVREMDLDDAGDGNAFDMT